MNWISVKECLPEPGVPVWVTGEGQCACATVGRDCDPWEPCGVGELIILPMPGDRNGIGLTFEPTAWAEIILPQFDEADHRDPEADHA